MIKSFKQFNEEVSGTELIGPVGPAYGETRIQNKTINSHDTNVIYSDLDNMFYTIDEYNEIYNDYLKVGGKPLFGFSIENIYIILDFLKKI